MIIIDIFNLIFTQPITNILLGIYQLLSSAGVPFALGFSIIALTVVLRVLLYPLMAAQIKSSKKMQELSPELKEIREKYKKDRQKQQEMTMALYKKNGINPAAGCLPALIQLPIILALYQVIFKIAAIDSFDKFLNQINPLLYFDFLKPTELWETLFFGVGLAQKPQEMISTMPVAAVIIPLLTGLTQLILSKMMMSKKMPPKIDGKEDFQTSFMKQSLFIFPIMIGFFSYTLPVGLSLYWITFTVFGILQQYLQAGFGALTNWVPMLEKYERNRK